MEQSESDYAKAIVALDNMFLWYWIERYGMTRNYEDVLAPNDGVVNDALDVLDKANTEHGIPITARIANLIRFRANRK